MKFLNKRYEERFFYKEEYWLAALGVFLSGYPGFLLYLVIILAGILIGSALGKDRFSPYHLWIPAAILVIIVSKWLIASEIGLMLKI